MDGTAIYDRPTTIAPAGAISGAKKSLISNKYLISCHLFSDHHSYKGVSMSKTQNIAEC